MVVQYLELGLYIVGGLIILYILYYIFFRRKTYARKQETLYQAHQVGGMTRREYKKHARKLTEQQKREKTKQEAEKQYKEGALRLQRAYKEGALSKQEFNYQLKRLAKRLKR